MGVLSALEPKAVFAYFEKLAAIPHGSHNTKAISDFCASFAKEQGLSYTQDEVGNVIIKKPASPGYENAPTMILQGHLDMVCAKEPGLDFDFTKDSLRLRTDGQWVSATDTTLGADNGIAVAMTLALLASDEAAHPPLEALFTIDEEVGLDGAKALDAGALQGKYLLNLDSEEEGVLTAGCAGGIRVDCLVPVKKTARQGIRCTVTVDGLTGGHSGMEIDKGRGNSNKIMGRVLRAMAMDGNFGLANIEGGFADNAIPYKTVAELIAEEASVDILKAVTEKYQKILSNEYRTADPGVKLTLEIGEKVAGRAADEESTNNVIFVLFNSINGVQAMSMELPGLVQSSLNLGIVKMDDDKCSMSYAVRSSVATRKDEMCDRLHDLTVFTGGRVFMRAAYPAWEYRPQSKLRDMMNECYQAITGEKLKVTATHGGLECGVLSDKLPGLDCVSFGPTILDAHSTRERMNVASVERTYRFLLDVLKNADKLE